MLAVVGMYNFVCQTNSCKFNTVPVFPKVGGKGPLGGVERYGGGAARQDGAVRGRQGGFRSS